MGTKSQQAQSGESPKMWYGQIEQPHQVGPFEPVHMGDDPDLKWDDDINEIKLAKTSGKSNYDCMVQSKNQIKSDSSRRIFCFSAKVCKEEIFGSGLGWMLYSRVKPTTLILDFYRGDFGYFQGNWETIENIMPANMLKTDYDVTCYINLDTCNVWYIINGKKTKELNIPEIKDQTILPVIWRAGQDGHKITQYSVAEEEIQKKPENWLSDPIQIESYKRDMLMDAYFDKLFEKQEEKPEPVAQAVQNPYVRQATFSQPQVSPTRIVEKIVEVEKKKPVTYSVSIQTKPESQTYSPRASRRAATSKTDVTSPKTSDQFESAAVQLANSKMLTAMEDLITVKEQLVQVKADNTELEKQLGKSDRKVQDLTDKIKQLAKTEQSNKIFENQISILQNQKQEDQSCIFSLEQSIATLNGQLEKQNGKLSTFMARMDKYDEQTKSDSKFESGPTKNKAFDSLNRSQMITSNNIEQFTSQDPPIRIPDQIIQTATSRKQRSTMIQPKTSGLSAIIPASNPFMDRSQDIGSPKSIASPRSAMNVLLDEPNMEEMIRPIIQLCKAQQHPELLQNLIWEFVSKINFDSEERKMQARLQNKKFVAVSSYLNHVGDAQVKEFCKPFPIQNEKKLNENIGIYLKRVIKEIEGTGNSEETDVDIDSFLEQTQ